MRIAIIGTGYVGLVTGTCLAEDGNDVTCVDIDEGRIRQLDRAIKHLSGSDRNPDPKDKFPIYEPGLPEMTLRNVKAGRLRFTTDYGAAVPNADICFIAVGTPQDHNGGADLTFVLQAAESIARHTTRFLVVVDKSTVPVGTGQLVEKTIRSHTSHDVAVISNPEFLKEGDAVNDFRVPDRVVVGYDPEAPHATTVRETMETLYKNFVDDERPLVFMNRESAELTKYAANAMLATRISFMNEVANVCERVGANVEDVSHGMGLDKRIGAQFLRAGLGYGGSCFPKDVRAIIHTAAGRGYDFRIVQAVDDVNEDQKQKLAASVVKKFGKDLSNRTFAVWGLAFKPETDDMREAPSIVTVGRLLAAGATVNVHDPEATDNFLEIARATWTSEHLSRLKDHNDPMMALEDADGLLLVTEWNVFRTPNWNEVKGKMHTPVVFDGRNIYDRRTVERAGLEYFGVGV